MKDGKLQWHPAFGAALRIELADEIEKVQIEEEHLLGKKPMQVDCLVIKVEKDRLIHKNIGRLFKKHNIVEYKSPDESLSINDFYKVYGYACFYQSDTDKVMEISPEELGITFVCNHYPRKMLQHIQNTRGITVNKREEGIYELTGDPIPMQLIITHQLTKEKNFWIQSLRKDLKSGGEIRDLLDAYDKKKTQPLYQAVMDVIIRANQKEAEVEKKMCEALKLLFAEELQEAEQRGKKAGIKYGEEIGIKRGEEIGEQTGIKVLVEVLHDLQIAQNEVSDRIVEKFKVSRNDAENYVKAYYK